MAEVNNCSEPTFPTKRIPDLATRDSILEPKKPKLDSPQNDNNGNQTPQNVVVSNEEKPTQQPELKQQQQQEEKEEQEEEVKEEEKEEERIINGKAEIDRKGKGILIEEDDEEEDEDEDDDDDDDDDDSGSDSDSDSDNPICDGLSEDSDFADDPLAEVDLDNILPSRTRRKSINPGSYDLPPEADDDSDDSDDPDA